MVVRNWNGLVRLCETYLEIDEKTAYISVQYTSTDSGEIA